MSIASLYPSINPSLLLDFANSKVLDPRITFSRTTTATYYDGVTTAKAEENLLTNSAAFTPFTTTGSSLTANSTTAPDGTSTAYTLTEDTANSTHRLNWGSPPSGSAGALSVYAKANSAGRYLYISTYTTAARIAIFDLSGAGTVTQSNASSTATITSVGNGWYRCSVSVNETVTYLEFGLSNATTGSTTTAPTYTGNGSSMYIWGPQFELRNAVTAYTATTTQAITNYIPVLQTASAGQARFDHNPTTGESLGLLIEEASTNVATYSEDFGNAAWNKGGSVVAAPVVTINQVIAPNGTLTGDQVDLPAVSGTNAFSLIYYPFTASASAYTGSFYLKGKNGGEQIWINFTKNGVNYTQTLCTLTTSWQRFSLSSTLTAGGDNFQIGVDLRDSAESAKSAQTFFIWGAQLETKFFPTSYIPTTSASVTRNADAASMTGTNFSSWYNTAEGTFYAEATAKAAYALVEANNGSSNERIGLGQDPNRMYQLDTQNGTYWAISYTTAGGALLGSSNKVAGAFKTNDFAVAANGGSVTTDTNGQIGVPTLLQIGRSNLGATGEYSNSTIKKIAYYPIRVTNAQLQALTV